MNGVISIADRQCTVRLRSEKRFTDHSFSRSADGRELWTQGVFLNIELLKTSFGTDSLPETVEEAVRRAGTELSQTLFGSYALLFRDSEKSTVILTNDLLSKHSLFYAVFGGELLFSDSFLELADECRHRDFPLTPDALAVKMMDRHEELYGDITYAREIHFLEPFRCLTVDASGVHKVKIPPKTETLGDRTEIIARCDELFTEGTYREYELNRQYGYRQVTTLSAGMDSRMVYFCGKKLGFEHQTCFCYAQPGCVDHRIPQRICAKEGDEFFFSPLRDGSFLLNRDTPATANGGLMLYAGTTGLPGMLKTLPTEDWGIIHTGLAGGETMGDDCSPDEEQGKAWWLRVLNAAPDESARLEALFGEYEGYNQFVDYNNVRFCLNSQKIAADYGEYMSPFLYEPYFQYTQQIPYERKKDRDLYLDWMKAYSRDSYRVTYHYGVRTRSPFEYFIRRGIHYVVRRLGGKTKYDMNPHWYWAKKDPSLMSATEEMFREDIETLQSAGTIGEDILQILLSDWQGRGLDNRTSVLTASWALKRLFAPQTHQV